MFNFIPFRRVIKLCVKRNSTTRRDRSHIPLQYASLHECLDTTPDQRGLFICRPWFLLLLTLPGFYYMYSCLFATNRAGTQYYNNYPDFEFYSAAVEKFMSKKTTSTTTIRVMTEVSSLCVVNYTKFGKIVVTKNMSKILLDNQYPKIQKGGFYSPSDCVSRHKVAILVPFRDREINLAVFLYNIHPFLMNQKLSYRIFVLEQSGREAFNKGRLYNAGFRELKEDAEKYGKWKCMIFHDVDLLPLDERILYTCPTFPRHMCSTVVEKKKDPSYHALFGGVTSMTLEQYEKANGYSNLYWGWGGEDNDMFWRLRSSGYPVVRYNKSIAQYTALPHKPNPVNRQRFELLHTAMERWKEEGLSNVEYKLQRVTLRHLYTHLIIDVNPYHDNITALMKSH